jgi:hypothetical protein
MNYFILMHITKCAGYIMGYKQSLLHKLSVPVVVFSTSERLWNKAHDINIFLPKALIPFAYFVMQRSIQSVHVKEKCRIKEIACVQASSNFDNMRVS